MPHAHLDADGNPATERWLKATWPFVRGELPNQPANVLEIGCGPYGGFIPRLLREGHRAEGIDPEAPEGRAYHRTEYERYEQRDQVDVVVASASLHHVVDIGQALDRVKATLKPHGRVIVVEWALERFDEPTAKWCFDRLPIHESDDEAGWLHRHRDQWKASGQPWVVYFQNWKQAERLHSSQEVLRELDTRFERLAYREVPYFFPDLAETTRVDEQAAIDTLQIQAACIQYSAQNR